MTALPEVDLTIDADMYDVTGDDKAPSTRLRAAAERLAALDKAATPGAWWVDERHGRDHSDEGYCYVGLRVGGSESRPREIAYLLDDGYGSDEPHPREDADLIAALRPVVAPLATLLSAAADRWEADVLLDRPEGDEMSTAPPPAWWCGVCQGAIASRDYANDDMRCHCGWWVEALTLAGAVLGPAEVQP